MTSGDRPTGESASIDSTEPVRGQGPSTPRRLSRRKKVVFGLLTAAIFFAAVEAVLALLGVRPSREIHDPFVGFEGGEPLFVREGDRWVTNSVKLSFFNPQSFAAEKPDGACRIFCLGGSTTFGRPYDFRTAYPQWLENWLEQAHPSRQWEVVNCGGISYASYRLALLCEELVEHQPDLFIVYTGHNEFLEERTYGEVRDWTGAFRGVVSLASYSRLFGLMESVMRRDREAPEPDTTMSSEVNTILEHSNGPETYRRDAELRRRVLDHYEFSLHRIAHLADTAGADVVFVQPASNIKDFSPFKSEHSSLSAGGRAKFDELLAEGRRLLAESKPEEALGPLREAEQMDQRHADLLFTIGQAQLQAGDIDAARDYLVRARDEDVCPLRAPSEIGEIVERVGRELDIPVVDYPQLLQTACRQRTGHDLLGLESFLDHVHPQIEAHGQLGRALYDTLAQLKIVEAGSAAGSPDAVAKQVAGTIQSKIAREDHARAFYNLAMTLSWAGKNEEALRLTESPLMPDTAEVASLRGRLLRKLGRGEQAFSQLEEAVRKDPTDSLALSRLANEYGHQGQFDKARDYLQQAIEHTPERAPIGFRAGLHVQLGQALFLLEDKPAAQRAFRRALEIDPQSKAAKDWLERISSAP